MRRDLAALCDRHFDLAIIGGGVVGACAARDAALRGHKVALVEAGDFATGASEAMSHFIHGGLRYLAQGKLAIVRESLAERAIWRRIAPAFVTPIPFLLRLAGGPLERGVLRAGVAMFEALAGHGLGRHLDAAAAAEAEPLLAGAAPHGAVLYGDCRIDHPERAVIALLADAAAHGAAIANHVEATGLLREGARVAGLIAEDRRSGGRLAIRADAVLNATGPSAERVATRLLPGQRDIRLTLSKGIHLVTAPLARENAIAIATADGHAVISPWAGQTLVGTTDEAFSGDPAGVAPTAEEIAALAGRVAAALPAAGAALAAPLDAFAGVRALPHADGGTYTASRDMVLVRHGGAIGLVTLTGGKWTTARLMAERGVDLVEQALGRRGRACETATRPLPDGWGAADPGLAEPERFACAVDTEMALDGEDIARRLTRAHGVAHPGVAGRAAGWLAKRGKNEHGGADSGEGGP